MRTVNIAAKLAKFSEVYSPKIVGELNDAHIKLVKVRGEFVWHHHDHEDEMFLVISGTLRMRYREDGREHEELVRPGEFIIMPSGVEHCPSSADPEQEVAVMLLEPKTTLNTGNIQNERTVAQLESI